MELKYLKENYKKLLEEEEDGNTAKLVKPFIDKFCDKTIEDCKEKFSTMDINYYQNIDNREIFMLQLNIRVAKELKAFLELCIIDGERANEKLSVIRN